jgi:putative ABC transport system permease protein
MNTIASIRINDLIPLAWSSLRRNRLRSSLTVGAIAVAISLVVYLVSLGFGLEQLTLGTVQRSSSLLSLTVETASKELNPLNQEAVNRITNVLGVASVQPRFTLKGQVILDRTRANTTVVGVDPDYLQVTSSTQLLVGRYYRPDDVQAMVVTTGFLNLYGLDTKKTPLVLFDIELDPLSYPGVERLRDVIVTGVVEADDSQVAYLPTAYLESVIPQGALPPYEHVKVMVADINQIEPAREDLITRGFKVSAAVDTVDDIKNAFRWIRGILAGLGIVAIFIATIGMFNTLTISLLERTREIGIMKALGVRNKDVGRIFLMEAVLIGLLGGVAGLIGAFFLQQLTLFILSLLAALAEGRVPVLFVNHALLIVGALTFAILIAVVTGFYPARRATKLNPIDAIRYE